MRKLQRGKIRRMYGNRGLRDIWAGKQARKYGKDYLDICKPSTRRAL